MDMSFEIRMRDDAIRTIPCVDQAQGYDLREPLSGAAAAVALPIDTVPAEDCERASLSDWLGVAAGTIGGFMATLDMTVVNSALPTIQGEISATPSEGTWVGNSYLIAEICLIPLTAWLTRMLGLRRIEFYGVAGFTVFSVLCGFASSLPELVIGRMGQGIFGAMLLSTSFTICATRLPKKQQPIGLAVGGITAVLGPILGPLIGGWITENYSWQYIFYMNVPICAVVLACCLAGLPSVKCAWEELAHADWYGIVGMMTALGALSTFLELGYRNHWFESPMICALAAATLVGFALVAVGQFRSQHPVIKLALLRNPGLAAPVGLQIMMGVLLFGSLFTIPQFLGAVAGYNAEQSGWVIMKFGASAILGASLYPILIRKLDLRIVVAFAFCVQAAASWLSTDLTSSSVGADFTKSLMFVGIGITLASIPQHQAAMAASTPETASETSSLLMIARNLGGSMGLAIIAAFHEYRLDLHHAQLEASLSANDVALQAYVAGLTAQFGGGPEGLNMAYRAIDGQTMLQALVMSFNDVFLFFCVGTLLAVPFVLFLRPLEQVSTAHGAH